jgi:hypothetical protein
MVSTCFNIPEKYWSSGIISPDMVENYVENMCFFFETTNQFELSVCACVCCPTCCHMCCPRRAMHLENCRAELLAELQTMENATGDQGRTQTQPAAAMAL